MSAQNKSTALLCIDMQKLDASEHHGLLADSPAADVSYYMARLRDVVLPRVQRLQRAFRAAQLEVIHTRIQSLTRDGRDRSASHKQLGLHAPPGSQLAQFLDEVAPEGDEIVIDKTASGVFAATNIHYVLRNLGVDALVLAGVYTNECVSSAARNACDLGYDVTVVADGCAAPTAALHDGALVSLRDRYARVRTTDEVIRQLERPA